MVFKRWTPKDITDKKAEKQFWRKVKKRKGKYAKADELEAMFGY